MNWLKKNRVYLLLLTVVLLAGAAVLEYYSNISERLPVVTEKLEPQLDELEKEFYSLVNSEVVSKVCSDKYDLEDFDEIEDDRFSLLIYNDKDLIFWSKNEAEISYSELGKYGLGVNYDRLKNGYYMIIRTTRNPPELGIIDVVGLYLLKTDYGEFENRHLTNLVNPTLNISNSVNFSTKPSLATTQLKGNSSSLYVSVGEDGWDATQIAIFLILLTCIILGLILVYGYSVELAKGRLATQGLLLLGTILFCLRLLTYLFDVLPNLRTLEMFVLQTNGLLFGSLGDLLITVIFVWIFVKFLVDYVPLRIKFPVDYGRRQLFYGVIILIFTGAVWLSSLLAQNTILYSNASFKIVDLLRLKTLVSLSIIFIVFHCLFILTKRLAIVAGNLNIHRQDRFKLALLTIIGFVLLHIGLNVTFTSFVVAAFILLFAWFTDKISKSERSNLTVVYLLFWITFFSSIVALHVNIYDAEREENQRVELAKELIKQENLTAEVLLEGIALKMISDGTIRAYYRTPFLPKSELYQRVRNKYFNEYFTRYDVSIYLFDANGNPLRGMGKLDKSYFDQKILDNTLDTKNNYVYSVINPQGSFSYILRLQVFNSASPQNNGYIVVEISEDETEKTVYPELVLPDKFRSPTYIEDYNYAIYKKDKSETVVGNFPYPEVRGIDYKTANKYKFLTKDGFSHLIYNDAPHPKDKQNIFKSAIVSMREKGLLENFTLFSYLFVFLIFIVLLFLVIRAFVFEPSQKIVLRNLLFSSLRKRINTLLVIIVFISLLAIGLITVWYFTMRSGENQKMRLERIRNSVVAAMEYEFENIDMQQDKDKVIETVKEISDIHNIDVSLYDLDGSLIGSSLPILFDRGVVSKRMNGNAFTKLKIDYQRKAIQTENIGTLEYLAAYSTIKNANNNEIAYLHIPYFARDKNVQLDISNFLVVLFNVYIFILLLAVLSGVFLSNSVTRSLVLIGEKLRQIRLGGKNEKLEWPDNDEIGALVNQYNSAITDLDQSVEMLAQAEREYAWQEMAKQVAHEIKNPLTPMKLSIQHLQRAQSENHPRLMEMTEKVTKTLIEQIEHLTKIANEFSSFAQMPKPQEEYIELSEMLQNMLSLYEENGEDNLTIVKHFPREDAFIFADRTQINRVFLNIVKNALEAMDETPRKLLAVKIQIKDEKVLLGFTDNGKGIPEDQKRKIFVPSFTSKNSGMGLGLAISKNIIESSGGRIWFETELGRGTTFYIELPLRN